MSVIALARQQAARDAGSDGDLEIARISLTALETARFAALPSPSASGKSRLARSMDRLLNAEDPDDYPAEHDDASAAPPPSAPPASGRGRHAGPPDPPVPAPTGDPVNNGPLGPPGHASQSLPATDDARREELVGAVERLRARTDAVSLEVATEPRTSTVTATGGGTLLDKLMVHIPSDALALYATGLAFLSQSSPGYRWALAGIIAAFAVGLAVGVYRREIRAAEGSFSWPWSLTFTVLFAFTAYVCVIPASPFEQFSFYGPVFAGMVGVIANAVLALVAVWTEP